MAVPSREARAERASDRVATRGLERALFAGLALVQLVPVWAVRWFPTQDGALHLEMASLLLRLTGSPDQVAARYFALNPELEPTWLLYLPLGGLVAATSPRVAEKLLVTAFVLAFALALRYALEGVRKGAGFLAALGLPFAFSYPLHMGFYNHCFGMVLCFVTLGFWLRRPAPPRTGDVLGLGSLLLLVYFAHPVPLVMALSTLAALALAGAAAELVDRRRRGERLGGALPGVARRCLLPLLAAASPALVLLALFLGRQGAGEVTHWPLLTLLGHLATLSSLVSFDRRELLVSVATLGVFAAVAAPLLAARLRRRSFSRRDALLGAALVALVAYLAAPARIAGGGYLSQRLQLFVPLLLLLWFGTEAALDRFRPAVSAAGAILTLGLLAIHAVQYRALAPELEEYGSGEEVLAPRSTLLALSLAHSGVAPDGGPLSRRVRPFQHAAAGLAVRRDLVDLVNYQASTGYFPILYRPECNPYGLLGRVEELEEADVPRPDLDGYEGRPCHIDYVLLWGLTPARRAEPEVAALVRDIEADFEPVFVSPGRALLHLYRRRPAAPPRQGPGQGLAHPAVALPVPVTVDGEAQAAQVLAGEQAVEQEVGDAPLGEPADQEGGVFRLARVRAVRQHDEQLHPGALGQGAARLEARQAALVGLPRGPPRLAAA